MAYEVKDGYQKFRDKEPLILEPEDWTSQEWATLCKLCGLPLGQTERIVLHANEMECFVDLSKKALDSERTYIVTELCPHCENEIEMRWDTDTQGFQAFCPVCGERLMLCDECLHTGGGRCDYDSDKDICYRRRMEMTVMPPLEVETPLGTIIAKGANDGEHPGVLLSLVRWGVQREISLALVEFAEDEADLPEGEPNLITRVWGNGRKRDYTDRIVHKGIEEFFKVEEEPQCTE